MWLAKLKILKIKAMLKWWISSNKFVIFIVLIQGLSRFHVKCWMIFCCLHVPDHCQFWLVLYNEFKIVRIFYSTTAIHDLVKNQPKCKSLQATWFLSHCILKALLSRGFSFSKVRYVSSLDGIWYIWHLAGDCMILTACCQNQLRNENIAHIALQCDDILRDVCSHHVSTRTTNLAMHTSPKIKILAKNYVLVVCYKYSMKLL